MARAASRVARAAPVRLSRVERSASSDSQYGDPARLPVQPEARSAALVIPLPTQEFGFAFGGQVLVHQPHRGRAVTDGGGNPFDRPVAGVPDRENSRDRRLERERRTVQGPAGRM